MWNITSKFSGKLPEEFMLLEDVDCLYLVYRGQEVARFSAKGATIEAIEKEAQRYLQKLEKKD